MFYNYLQLQVTSFNKMLVRTNNKFRYIHVIQLFTNYKLLPGI